jgi:hypothetical protein
MIGNRRAERPDIVPGLRRSKILQAALIAITLCAAVPPVQASEAHNVQIEVQPLGSALTLLATQTGIQIVYAADLVQGLVAPRLQGAMTPEEALSLVLAHTGLRYEFIDAQTVTITATASLPRQSQQDQQTKRSSSGLRIHGAQLNQTQTMPVANERPSHLPQVTVQARRELERRVRRFVSKVTGSLVSDDAVQLWSTPLCPAIAGLPRSEGEPVFAYLEQTVRALGITLAPIGCRPNLVIVATPQPEALINAMSHRWPWVFHYGSGLQSFLDTARPVRIWYNADLVDEYGVPSDVATLGPGMSGGGAPLMRVRATSPRSDYWSIHQLHTVIAFVDLKRADGFAWRQIVDYVVMTGLTRVDPDANFGDAPTILRLFSATDKDRPTGLTDWDKALLKELYQTSPLLRNQRIDVSLRMAHDIMP